MSETIFEDDGVKVQPGSATGIEIKTNDGYKHLTTNELRTLAENEDVARSVLLNRCACDEGE